MDLTLDQQTELKAWIDEGASLSEIQQRLEASFGLNLTFMEVRFLIDDLDLTVKEKPARADADLSKAPTPPDSLDSGGADGLGGPPGSVRVEVDAVQRPGAMISGSVTFSGGQSMGWQVDQMGRLGLIPGKDPDFRPSEDDLMTFQAELQETLKKKGF